MKSHQYTFSQISCSIIWSLALTANAPAYSQRDDDAMSYYRAGTEHYKQRDYKAAVDAFKKAIELNSDYAEAHRDLGNSYFSLREYWKAYETYVQALRLHDEFGWKSQSREWFEPRINLAIAYCIIGNRLGAIGIFSTEIRDRGASDLIAHVESDNPKVYLYLGEAYLGMDSANSADKRHLWLTAAAESLERAIRLDPKYAEAYVFLGRVQSELRENSRAIEAYDHAIRIDPRSADAHYYLALAHLRINDRQSALKQYRILRRLDRELAKKVYQLISK